jgi:hypothetical protein
MNISSQPLFLPGSGTPDTPQLVKAARGPASIDARSASTLLAHRALVLALTAGVKSGGRKKGHYAHFPLTLRLVDHATLAVTPTPPQSLLLPA